MHDGKLSVIERSIQLARGGTCANVEQIRGVLAREGYEGIHANLEGASMKKKLRSLIAAAQPIFKP